MTGIAAVVLAGGASRRMGRSKPFVELGGQTMLDRVLQRVAPQVDELAVAVGTDVDDFGAVALPLIQDRTPSRRGPLAGLDAALAWLPPSCDRLVIVPCDAPFLPSDLVERLAADADQENPVEADDPVVVAAHAAGRVQPTFSLWHRAHAPAVGRALADERGGGLVHLFRQLPHRELAFPTADDACFLNVNSPADLDEARARIEAGATG